MKFSAMIVDDEKPQQEILSGMMQNFRNYTVKKICSSVDDALINIRSLKPDLIFLDVVMPPKSGFDLLNEIGDVNFDIIFTTSFEEYAIKAFRVSAVDYLLKPFDLSDLSSALQKFEDKVSMRKSFDHIKNLLYNINTNTLSSNRIALPTLNGLVFVNIGDIIRCESDDMYTTFFFKDKSTLMVSKNIKECEELLSDYSFFRVHNSHLINLNYIQKYIKGDGGQIKMTDGSMVTVSRRRKDDFLQLLKKL